MKYKKYYLLAAFMTFLVANIDSIQAQEKSLFQEIKSAFFGNPNVTIEDLKGRASDRIAFWETVIKAFKNYGVKDDSDEMGKANKYLKRAETAKSNLAGLTKEKLTTIKGKLKRAGRRVGLGRGRGRPRVTTGKDTKARTARTKAPRRKLTKNPRRTQTAKKTALTRTKEKAAATKKDTTTSAKKATTGTRKKGGLLSRLRSNEISTE